MTADIAYLQTLQQPLEELNRLFDAQRASALGVPVNSASLCVTRRYRDASGQVLLLSQTHHPAERFTYSFDLLRGGDGSAWLAA